MKQSVDDDPHWNFKTSKASLLVFEINSLYLKQNYVEKIVRPKINIVIIKVELLKETIIFSNVFTLFIFIIVFQYFTYGLQTLTSYCIHKTKEEILHKRRSL